MRVAVLGSSRSGSDPWTIRLVNTLASVGHDVTFISVGSPSRQLAQVSDHVVTVDTRWPLSRGRPSDQLRRFNPKWFRSWLAERRALDALAGASPAVVHPTNERMARIADDAGYPVSVEPRSRVRVENDFAELALEDPSLSGAVFVLQHDAAGGVPSVPIAGRHEGKRVTMCYNATETNPGRYLRAAFERAGVQVDHRYPSVDLSTIPSGSDAVLFVESPYPAVEVIGATDRPVLYWVHHGEHHLNQNLRLARRYQADVILLAHSWHLGYRFDMPMTRFPFGVPIEMIREPVLWHNRSIDAAMIGAGFAEQGERYHRRRRVADQSTSHLGAERTRFEGGLTPEEVFDAYGDSKVVVDEGGELHRPITMRVFEAMGSGATVVTDPAPGLDQLFDSATDFLTLDLDDVVGSMELTTTAGEVAAAGQDRAMGYHTYDHRVDEFFGIAEQAQKTPAMPDATPLPFGPIVGRFAEIDSVGCSEASSSSWFDSSYVVRLHQDIVRRGSDVDAVILTPEDAVSSELLGRSHRYVICSASLTSTVREMLTDADRSFKETRSDDVAIFDFKVPGYVVRDES
jgi:hypothetical protein